jgi:hypothetical protein
MNTGIQAGSQAKIPKAFQENMKQGRQNERVKKYGDTTYRLESTNPLVSHGNLRILESR